MGPGPYHLGAGEDKDLDRSHLLYQELSTNMMEGLKLVEMSGREGNWLNGIQM